MRKDSASSEDAALVSVLLDDTVELSPLFRYCAAVFSRNNDPERFGKVIEYYYEPALVQYMRSKKNYDEIWREFIPEDFRREAPRKYEALIATKANSPTSSELKRNIYR